MEKILKIPCPCCKQSFIPASSTVDDVIDSSGESLFDNYSEDIIFKCPNCKSLFYMTVSYKTEIKGLDLLEVIENKTQK